MITRFLALSFAGLLAIAAPRLALAAGDPPSLESYAKLPGVEAAHLSPSGKLFAVIATVGDQRSLVVGEVSGKPLMKAPVGKNKVRSLAWAGDDHLLVFTSATVDLGYDYVSPREELETILHVDLRTGKSNWVLGGSNHAMAIFGYYGSKLQAGRWYGWFAALPNEYDPPVLYRIDLESGAAQPVAHGETGMITDWLVGADGAVVAHAELDRETGRWQLRTGASAGKVLLAETAPINTMDLAGFGRTHDTLLVEHSGATDQDYEEIPLSGDGPHARPAPGKSVESLYRDEGGALIGFGLDDDSRALFFDATRQARWTGTRKAFDGYSARLVSYTQDLGRMIVHTDAGDDSGTYWLVDIPTGDAKVLGRAYPGVRGADVAPTRMFSYLAADGLSMDGVLTLPKGREAKGLPLVVIPHGGPIVDGDKPGFDWEAQAFASRGYAVFQPNYRGTLGHGYAFMAAAYGEWGGKMQTDISDGVAALAKAGIVDARRACIVGASYGGYAALAGVTLQQGLYRCAVSTAGVADLKAMLGWEVALHGRTTPTMRFWRTVMGARSNSDPELNRRSPARFADQADAPVLLIHGKDDTVVPLEQSQIMERALKRAGKPVELLVLEGQDHWESDEQGRLATLKAEMAFVQKHNPAN